MSSIKKLSGFTLIELLVVISIISLLSSVVLASLSAARERARISAGKNFAQTLHNTLGSEARGIWNFREGSGATTRNEVTNTLESIVGATWTSGIRDSAMYFNGTDGLYVNIADVGQMPAFTLSAWIYSESGGHARQSIVGNFWEVVDTQLCFWSYDFAHDYWRCTAVGTLPKDKWVHVATSWNGSVISHYIDGKHVWTDTVTSSGTNQAFTVIAGYTGRAFKGSIDEVRIYAEAIR
jgi:prepilin-type N-terminal cleavage/methylation domain-containing protein